MKIAGSVSKKFCPTEIKEKGWEEEREKKSKEGRKRGRRKEREKKESKKEARCQETIRYAANRV